MPEDLTYLFDEQEELQVNEAPAAFAPLEHEVSGEVMRIVYVSPEGDYTVARLRDANGKELVLVGNMPGLLEGQEIRASGRWELHRDHGRQLRVFSYEAVLPSSLEGIRRFLASGVLPGIGETYAERIVKHFGTDTLKILDTASSRLKEVPGIGKKRIQEIRDAWKSTSEERETRVFLQGVGISASLCTKLIAKYGKGAAGEIVRRNPYRLASEIEGVGFLTADAIAARLGIERDSPLRLCAGMVYAMEELAARGHTCCPEEVLLLEAEKLLHAPREALLKGLQTSLDENKLSAETIPEKGEEVRFIFLRRLRQYEIDLAASIRVLLNNPLPPLSLLPKAMDRSIQLNQAQLQAVHYALQHGFSIVTGGPGVGKTTVINTIVKAFRAWRKMVFLAAPTGRAAKRLGEATGCEAQTIHRLLKWDVQTRSFTYNEEKPLSCDVLIVDEASMLDTQLAQSLFCAVSPGTRVVLVGDRDQLPSVGPGAVLHDLIHCGLIPVTHLTEVYRQSKGSRIITNAHAVNKGEIPDISAPDGRGDFYWVENDDPVRAADQIVRLVTERIPKVFGFDPVSEVQVLAPMRKGECGTQALNSILQDGLNPPGEEKAEFSFGNRSFRKGDKVMQTSNNYDKGVFNGEMGIVSSIDRETAHFSVLFDSGNVDYQFHECDQLQLAYAVTVHKSQGSEYPVVIMPVLTQHFVMLQRNLLYTGMTRARKLLILIGSRRALTIAVGNNTPRRRKTMLAYRLQQR